MTNQIKYFFNNDKKASRIIFTLLMLGTLFLITGNGVSAYFQRTALEGTFGYGYGYGYGYDSAAYAYGYGYGYGANVNGYENYGFWGSSGAASSVSAAQSGNTSLIISYATSYLAKNKVYYGTTNTGTCSTLGSASSQTSFQTDFNSITLSNLSCDTTYYYCAASEDAGGNVWYSTIGSKATASCTTGGNPSGGSTTPPPTPTETTASTITASTGGEVTLTTTGGSTAKVVLPANAVATDVSVTIKSSAAGVLETAGTVGTAPVSLYKIGDLVFQITAADTQGGAVTSFSQAVTLTFTYTDSQISGLNESTLKIYKWNGTSWVALESAVNAATNTISATVTSFSYFAIMGEKPSATTTATTTPTASTTVITAELRAQIKQIIRQLVELIAQLIAQLQDQLKALLGGSIKILNIDLKYGDKGDAVTLLQTWLAKDKEIYPEGIVSGRFGPLTQQAVIRFQEKYAAEILTPLGLIKGTGIVDEKTRTKLNSLFK